MELCPNCFSSNSVKQNTCTVCGYPNQVKRDARALPVGVRLHGRYMIGRVLGIGGFGITYVSYDMERGERLAIKEYFPAEWAVRTLPDSRIVPNSQSMEKLYQHGKEVFFNEAGILSKLRQVPSVVNVLDLFAENQTAYMVMELLEGDTLRGYLKRHGMKSMPYPMAGEIVREVGNALHMVHGEMLLHRDVSPDNIMILGNQEIRLIDFGATRMYGLNSPKSMSVLVKPGFAPIEQYSRAGNQGPWTDVYALAATYYYLVAGKRPPDAPDRIAGYPVTPLRKINPSLPQQISDAIDHALSEDWRERPQCIRDFLLEMRLVGTQSNLYRTRWIWPSDSPQKIMNSDVPCLLMQVGCQRTRYYFADNQILCIGRAAGNCQVVLRDSQVSGLHCKLWYDSGSSRFLVENYSANRTYTSRGILEKNQGIYLIKGEWIYIQTVRQRYIFYLEVEM